MTWMLIRLVLSLAFVGLVLWFAARVARKRGLGGGANGLIEVVARQRMGRASSVNVVRIGDVVLVVGATEEQVTLLAEVDNETIDLALRERQGARLTRLPTPVQDEHDDYAGDRGHEGDLGDAGEPGYAAEQGHGGGHGYAADHQPRGQHRPAVVPRSSGPLAGSVFDKNGWGGFVNQLRERTVRRP
jgi:flagellar protein FliO/FliZ